MMEHYQGLILWLAAQAVAILIWGVMMEMRMRNAERVAKEFWLLRDDVRDMKRDVEDLTKEFKDLNRTLAWMREPADDGAPSRPPRRGSTP